ncbi:MAG: hypothetical protein A2378_04485 [Candidatus Pacebacteria bacterium RIFOXYB1_FULL_44_10]|nr:MAG: hypothetical protein A2378_04485 [Candidatus Pacebacteria bacterium RIFOXYB1_FULL_44_10]
MQAVAHLDLDTTDMHIPLAYHAHTPLTSEEYKTLQENATYFVGKSPELIISNKHASISDQEMISFLHPRGGLNGEILSHYIEELKKNIDQNPVEPVLEIEQNIVVTFIPPEDGISLHSTQAVLELQSALEKMVSEKPKTLDAITLSFQSTPPTRPLESTNTLGIKEVIGTGESYFHHSIPNRVHNVKLTFDRIQHALILPGETFSFNATAGEISSRTGFKPAYVISKGQTVLGDGGGVCQVSTTVFRATLDAGLPIVKRKGHSYRVSYYEENSKPGFDATVYAPSTDFQFVNDTAHAILLRSFVDTELLYARVEFWGTQDGRVAEIQNYKQWGASRPLATRYVDDPTLPAGKLRQIDWSAPGLKTSFEYVVKKPNSDGNLEESRQVFSTVYQPWAAVYLRGTGN